MSDAVRDVRLAVDSFVAREVPDGRTRVCDLAVESGEDGVLITGTVSTHGVAQRLFDRLRAFPSVDCEASSVQILEDIGTTVTVTAVATPVRSDPDADAEQVTEILYGDEVVAYDSEEGWRRVAAPDGYVGWIRTDAIAPVDETAASHFEAVLRENVEVDGLSVGESTEGKIPNFLPIGVPCTIVDSHGDTVDVRFRTGLTVSLPAGVLSRPSGLPTGEEVVGIAQQFAGTEYEWGGMTTEGVDCSGLIWVSYRVFGVELPRDTDQQRVVGDEVSRDELQAGDLLFFPGHVAMSLGGTRYVHAHGDSGGFVESSLDPDDDDYIADLDEGLTCCRRLLPTR